MNCPDWEERIALHAEGDLPPQLAAEAAQHLAGCAGCRDFAAGMRRALDVLRAAHAEPIDLTAQAAVRARVLDQVHRRPKSAGPLAWAAALVASAAAVAFLLLPRPVPPPRVAPALRPAPAPQLQFAVAPPVPVAPTKPAVRKRRLAPKPKPPQPLLVKLVTDDPNVIIYWIPN